MCTIEDWQRLFKCVSKETVPKIYVPISTYIPSVLLEMTSELRAHNIDLIKKGTSNSIKNGNLNFKDVHDNVSRKEGYPD